MNIVVDTNILISLLIKPTGVIFDLFNLLSKSHHFYISDYTLAEMAKHNSKNVNIFPPHFIPEQVLEKAYLLAKDIDENDTIFLATTIFLNAYLWTGDKKLYNGLKAKNFSSIFNSAEIKAYKL